MGQNCWPSPGDIPCPPLWWMRCCIIFVSGMTAIFKAAWKTRNSGAVSAITLLTGNTAMEKPAGCPNASATVRDYWRKNGRTDPLHPRGSHWCPGHADLFWKGWMEKYGIWYSPRFSGTNYEFRFLAFITYYRLPKMFVKLLHGPWKHWSYGSIFSHNRYWMLLAFARPSGADKGKIKGRNSRVTNSNAIWRVG